MLIMILMFIFSKFCHSYNFGKIWYQNLMLSQLTLRAFRAHVPYVPTCLTYLRALRAFVPQITTCLRACAPTRLRTLNYDVPMCMRALIFHDLIYAYVPIYIFRAYEPLCLKLFRAYMRSFFACLRAYNHSQNIFIMAHFYTSYCCFSLDYLTFQNPKTKTS